MTQLPVLQTVAERLPPDLKADFQKYLQRMTELNVKISGPAAKITGNDFRFVDIRFYQFAEMLASRQEILKLAYPNQITPVVGLVDSDDPGGNMQTMVRGSTSAIAHKSKAMRWLVCSTIIVIGLCAVVAAFGVMQFTVWCFERVGLDLE